jgi:hypothetical protein
MDEQEAQMASMSLDNAYDDMNSSQRCGQYTSTSGPSSCSTFLCPCYEVSASHTVGCWHMTHLFLPEVENLCDGKMPFALLACALSTEQSTCV